MKTTKTLVAAVALIIPMLASAQSSTPRIDAREARQEARIDRGVQSGTLTEREAAKLDRGQQHVQNLETRATADGKVTAREKARIEHAQDVQSQRIYREKHDRQHDFNHDGRQDRPRQARAGQPRGQNR
jgi:Skp family chaperone for outer membrane proteins